MTSFVDMSSRLMDELTIKVSYLLPRETPLQLLSVGNA